MDKAAALPKQNVSISQHGQNSVPCDHLHQNVILGLSSRLAPSAIPKGDSLCRRVACLRHPQVIPIHMSGDRV